MIKRKRHIDTSDSDDLMVKAFEEDLRRLTGMIEEMFVENKAALLSPVFRDMMRDQGRKIEQYRMAMSGRLCVDNPCDDIKLS